MGTFCTTAMAFRNGAMERAAVLTGVNLSIETDQVGMFSRVTLTDLPDDPTDMRAKVNGFLSRADALFAKQLTNEVLTRLVS